MSTRLTGRSDPSSKVSSAPRRLGGKVCFLRVSASPRQERWPIPPDRTSLAPLALFDLGPRVPQCHRPVENQFAGRGIEIGAEIAEALELIAAARRGIGQRWLQLASRQGLQRIRVEIGGEDRKSAALASPTAD